MNCVTARSASTLGLLAPLVQIEWLLITHQLFEANGADVTRNERDKKLNFS